MPDFSTPSKEVFQLLQSYDYTVMLYGGDGNRVEDPTLARRMFARPQNIMVSIIEDGNNSTVRLYIGKKTQINDILGLLMSLRTAASKYNLLFNVRQYGREIEPKDFAGEITVQESAKRNSTMHVFEGLYGTSKSSYLQLENAKMIVRHSAKVDETKVGARSRCIESILIENSQGERMLFPTNNLSAGRAMTQHVSMGGGFADAVGAQISRMATDFANLGACTNYIGNNEASLSEGAISIREQCRTKMREMKKTFERMYRSKNGYMTEAKKMDDASRCLTEGQDDTVPEKIEELRKTLNLEHSSMLSDAVMESVCKMCMGKIKEDDMIDEAAPQPTTVSVMGRQVNAEVWNNLKQGHIELLGNPKQVDSKGDFSNPSYTNKSGELLNKFNSIVPLVKDDSLMNLLAFVADRQPEEKDPEVAKKMRTLMLFVVKAAGLKINEGIAESNSAIRSFSMWMKNFETRVALREGYDTWRDQESEHAEEKALHDFSVDEFLMSEYGEYLNKEEEIPASDIKSALESFFTSWIETHTGEYIEDVSHLADEKMGEVIAHLAREGVKIADGSESSDHEVDESETMDAVEGMDDDMGDLGVHREILDDCDMMEEDMMEEDMMEEDLTREDILLPNPNQGQSLAKEVTPRTVKDPDSGKDTQPDSAYINRLRALSGMTAPNRNKY